MDPQAAWQATTEIIREIPRSGLLIATVAAVLGSILGTGIARHYSRFGRFMASTSTMALAAILVLAEPAAEPERPSEVQLAPLAPGAACLYLIRNAYALDPADRTRAAARLARAALVAERTPALSLAYPRDLARLPEVARGIEAALTPPGDAS